MAARLPNSSNSMSSRAVSSSFSYVSCCTSSDLYHCSFCRNHAVRYWSPVASCSIEWFTRASRFTRIQQDNIVLPEYNLVLPELCLLPPVSTFFPVRFTQTASLSPTIHHVVLYYPYSLHSLLSCILSHSISPHRTLTHSEVNHLALTH